jgi:hypothetical protein
MQPGRVHGGQHAAIPFTLNTWSETPESSAISRLPPPSTNSAKATESTAPPNSAQQGAVGGATR